MRSLLLLSAAVLMAMVVRGDDPCAIDLAPNSWDADQQYGQSTDPYTWWMNPSCTPQKPDKLEVCTTDGATGFVGQWNIPAKGSACLFMMTEHIQWWTKSGDSITAAFALKDGSKTAAISIDCTGTSGGIHHVGNVVAEKTASNPDKFKYTFKMQTDPAGCEAVANTPKPGTPTPGTPSSQQGSEFESISGTPNPGTTPSGSNTPQPGGPVEGPSGNLDSGCGGGCVFLLILGVLIPVYAIGAILWNFRVGKRGKELAPHPHIWAEVVSLIKEGCIFTAQSICGLVDKCRGKGGE